MTLAAVANLPGHVAAGHAEPAAEQLEEGRLVDAG